jgi:hypothetical protein
MENVQDTQLEYNNSVNEFHVNGRVVRTTPAIRLRALGWKPSRDEIAYLIFEVSKAEKSGKYIS